MRTRRIHITGASGSGVSTLGRALADALAIPQHDTDDYFWLPTAPPYKEKRDPAARLRLMREMFLDRQDWILSGALETWGGSLIPLFDLVVFIRVPAEVRLARLRDREARRFGAAAVAPGGWRYQDTEEFLAWAAGYDQHDFRGRSLLRHQSWLEALPCEVLRLDGMQTREILAERVISALRA